MIWKAIALVFLGGGIGSVLRYLISVLLRNHVAHFPNATLLSNILSCLLLGYLIGLVGKDMMSTEMKLFLMTGICGGFSTFSTFSAETHRLFEANNAMTAIIYMSLSFFLGLICIYGGMKLAGS